MEYPFASFKSELNTQQLVQQSARFQALTDPAGLGRLLGVPENVLLRHAENPQYHSFYIPKPGGQKRFIQHPVTGLKMIQQQLNRYLQAVYHGIRPDCAQGFLVSPTDDPRPRNIYTNALAHCKSEWFLNMDLQDFFHTVTLTQLRDLFRHLFFFPPALTNTLTGLTACQGRLPMGAPTSPVLSNLVCLLLDYQLGALADQAKAVYTRYADDLTFSFAGPPPPDFVEQVRQVILFQNFKVNERKLRLQPRLEQPEITGLVIGCGPLPTLSKVWLRRLKEEVRILRWLLSEAVRERGIFHAYVFDRFRQSVRGQVEFVGFVRGKADRTYRKLAVKAG